MSIMIRNSKGISLIELVLTIALLGIVLVAIFTFYLFNYNTFYSGVNKYDLQHSKTMINIKIEEELKYADTIELDKEKPETFDDKNYIFLEDNILYIQHKKGNLTEAISDDKIIKINSIKFNIDDNYLTYTILGQSADEDVTINNSFELLNIKKYTQEDNNMQYIQYTLPKGIKGE